MERNSLLLLVSEPFVGLYEDLQLVFDLRREENGSHEPGTPLQKSQASPGKGWQCAAPSLWSGLGHGGSPAVPYVWSGVGTL